MTEVEFHICEGIGDTVFCGKVKNTEQGAMWDMRTRKNLDPNEVLRTAAAILVRRGEYSIFEHSNGKRYRLEAIELEDEK